MREMSVTEQRYKAVLAVIGDGRTVSEVATDWGVSRRTMHRWLVRYEGDGLEGLNDRSHRPAQSPHQMPPAVEAMVLEMRRSHPYWGARRIAFELVRKRVERAPSESAVYRCLVRAAVIDPVSRQRRRETWKRWERGAPIDELRRVSEQSLLSGRVTECQRVQEVPNEPVFMTQPCPRVSASTTECLPDGVN
jgi:transposase